MKVGFVVECQKDGPDAQVCRRLCELLSAYLGIPIDPIFEYAGNKDRLIQEAGLHADKLKRDGCERIILLWDKRPAWGFNAASMDCRKERTTMEKLVTQAGVNKAMVHYVCIVQELEAWLLADERAIRSVLSTAAHPASQIPSVRNPENVVKPKSKLVTLFESEKGKGRRYNETIHARLIVAEIDNHRKLKKCPSFVQFAEKVTGRGRAQLGLV